MTKQETMDATTFRRQFCKEPSEAKKHEPETGRITLWLPRLPKETHPNARVHWAKKAKAVKAQREAAWARAKQAMGLAKPWKAATVRVLYFTCAYRVDKDGILANCKGSFDGLQGVVVADDSTFTYLPVQVQKVKRDDPLQGCVQLVITKTA